MSAQPAIPQRIATDAQLLDTLGGKLADTNPATDQVSALLLAWRRQLDSTEARPAISSYIAELARREHIARELLLRQQREPMPLAALEDLANRTHDGDVVERYLNAELDALRGGAR